MATPNPSLPTSPTNSGSGPAASTRAKARKKVRVHPAGGAASSGAAVDDEEEFEDEEVDGPQQQQQQGDDQKEDTTIDRAALADMMKEMKAMREELLRLKQPPQPQPASFSLGAPSPPINDIAALVRALQDSAAQQAEQARRQQEVIAEQLAKPKTEQYDESTKDSK